MATPLRDTSLLGKIRELPGRQLQIAAILFQLVFALWIPWRLSQTPVLPFEVNAQLLAKSIPALPGAERAPVQIPNLGDQVLAVNGVAVSTRSELLSVLQGSSGGEAEFTIRRFNVALVKSLSPQSFEFGMPVGLQEGDLPVGLACQADASYVQIRSVNLEALEELVRDRSRDGASDVRVVFNRPQQDEVVKLPLSSPPWRHDLMGALLAGVLGQLLLWWLSGREQHPARQSKTAQHANLLSALVPLCTLAVFAVAARDATAADPALFAACTIGLALFKPLNFDLHLRARSGWVSPSLAVKLAIYAAPVIFLGQVLFFHLRRSGPSAVVAQARDAVEQQLDRFWWILLGCAGLLILLDVLTLLVRYHVRGKDDTTPSALASRIGLGFSLIGALSAVYLLANGDQRVLAGYFIAGAFCAQLLGDLVGMIDLPRAHWHEGDPQQALSPNNLKQFLLHTADLFPPERAALDRVWLVLRLVPLMGASQDPSQRSQPRTLHARLTLTPDEEVGHLLTARAVPSEWIDLLDMLQVEGGIVPRAAPPGREDPLDGTAHRLAISCVWPLDIRHSTALLSAHIVVAADPVTLDQWLPLDPLHVPSEALGALAERFIDITPAAVYHAVLGASSPLPLTAQPAPPPTAQPSAPTTPPAALAVDPAEGPAHPTRHSSKRLRATLRAMQAEVERLHPIHAFDPTESQAEALSKLAEAPPNNPILLCGEVGTGKALVARLLHSSLALTGPFLRLPAHELPEAVMPIELFGEDDALGLVEAAKHGILLIEGADRIPGALFSRLLQATAAPPAPRLLLTLDIPPNCANPLAKFDAEIAAHLPHIVRLASLREQPDAIEPLAFAFLHHASMRHGRVITDIEPAAMEALKRYPWTSNIQEMKHAIDAAVVRCRTDRLGVLDLAPPGLLPLPAPSPDLTPSSPSDPAPAPPQNLPSDPLSVDRTLDDLFASSYEEIERRLVSAAMRAAQGSKSKAARMLGMRRDILNAKLNKISPPPPPKEPPP